MTSAAVTSDADRPDSDQPGACLAVRIDGLRVVDAVISDMPSAHINATVMALAKRASYLIHGRSSWRR
jgi:choline dehydrogenase-like flavoprotein